MLKKNINLVIKSLLIEYFFITGLHAKTTISHHKPQDSFISRIAQTRKDLLSDTNITIPTYTIEQTCASQTQYQSLSYQACLANNQNAYNYLKRTWNNHYNDTRQACITQINNLKNPNYADLERCIDALDDSKKEAP